MPTKNLKTIANQLWDSHHEKKAIAPIIESMTEPTLEEAYTIQKLNHHKWISQGERLVGRKIGLTSPAIQKQLGVDQPDYGMLYASMGYGTGQIVDTSLFIQPKVEAEIALVLKKDLSFTQHTIADILGATDYVLPAIEIVDSRIADWKISIHDTVADNGSAAAFVLGSTPKDAASVDWDNAGMTILHKGEPVSNGSTKACMGNPLNAAVWLANKMVAQNMPLLAGDIILTGALGPMVVVEKESTYETHINSLGSVSISFS